MIVLVKPTPYEVSWDDAALDRLRSAVAAYDMPPAPRGSGWKYGCDQEFLAQLRSAWLDRFDAHTAMANLNRFPQFTYTVEGVDLRAVHVVGEAQGTRPLLLTHGWPGSIYEFWKVVEPLAFPSRYGGASEDAFDLVIPSLPGYGFSGRPQQPIGARITARLFDRLMRDGFGYSRYLAQGGDIGSGVSAWLGFDFPDAVRAIHLTFVLTHPDTAPENAQEREWQSAVRAVQQRLGAYAQLHATKPQSLAYAMHDSPMAQAAWIVERFHDWSDLRERPFEDIFAMDELLTNVMIYVMNGAFSTALWMYAAMNEQNDRRFPKDRRVEVPTAVALFRDPRLPYPPRSFVERGYRVERWTEMPRGGHFAASEAPDDFVAELRAWARSVA